MNPVVVTPITFPDKPKMLLELVSNQLLQYEREPTENSPSFAFERFKCFSKIVPALPVISPSASITTT